MRERRVESDIFYSSARNCINLNICDRDRRFFTDSWALEHPSRADVADWGQTEVSPGDDDPNNDKDYYVGQTSADSWHPLTMQSGTRTDYILHNQPVDADGAPYLSTSHMRRVFFYDPDGTKQDYHPATYESRHDYEHDIGDTNIYDFPDNFAWSDHYSIVGDFLFNRPVRSNPVPASGSGPDFGSEVVTFGSGQDQVTNLRSSDPRQYAWFFLSAAGGTISVGSTRPDEVQNDVYHPSDLSTPIPGYHGLETCFRDNVCGPVFDLPDDAYFVRFSISPSPRR